MTRIGPMQCKLSLNSITLIIISVLFDFFILFLLRVEKDHFIAWLCLHLSCVFRIANQLKIHR